MTLRERVLRIMEAWTAPRTCAEICGYLGRPVVTTATLSSLLVRMCNDGSLFRVRDCGPRGGYGYYLNRDRSDV